MKGKLSIPVLIAVLLLILSVAGCDQTQPRSNSVDSKPHLDLLRLEFDDSGCVIDEHTDGNLIIFTEDWSLSISPISGQPLRNVQSALEGVIRRGGPAYRSDTIQNSDSSVILHRYLRGIEDNHSVAQGDYLVELDGHWLYASVFARNPGELFDQNAVDRFFMSLQLLDTPRTDSVPPAWMEYQSQRGDKTPSAKFVLYMDPAPILLGEYSRYIALQNSRSLLPFTRDDHDKGGRMIGKELLEFYSKDDPITVRIDVWIHQKPPYEPEVERVYSGALTAKSSAIQIWSFGDPSSFSIEPGVYDVDILLRNRGQYETTSLPERDRFERNDLERYEIYLNAKSQD
ncbi:MAG: hypothetical protein KDA78_16310 [Planctomycetaceae bacterium]|nr:hypothetical protein [Planctomycetaceae bacterium]